MADTDAPDSDGHAAAHDGGQPELANVDLLCRMQLMAMELGCRIVVVDASDDLRDLIRIAGLDEVLLCPACAPAPVTRPLPLQSPRRPAPGSGP